MGLYLGKTTMKIGSTIKQLIGILNQETGLYRSMLVIIDQEKAAAVRSDLTALDEMGINKNKILFDLQKKEAKRRQLVAGLAEKLGYAVEALTLSRISQVVDEPLAGNLRLVRQDFLSVISQLQAANQRNKQIMEHSLTLLRNSFNLLDKLKTPNTVYYRTGNIQHTKSTGNCVCSEI